MRYIRIGPFILLHKKTLDPVRLAMYSALDVGEIHFETCALAQGAKGRLQYAQAILDRLTGRRTR